MVTTKASPWIRRGAAAVLLVAALGFAGQPGELPPLSSVPGSPRLPGKFVWADLVTDNASAAREFYSKLFGWTFMGGGSYFVGANEERPLCGIFQRPRPADRPEARPRWIAYMSVSSVDRAKRVVTKAGGRVLAEPVKLAGRGEQAVFADEEGAVFGVVKSSSGDPQDFAPDPGDWMWIQLLSRDGKKASEFYSDVGGYKVIENTATNRLTDYVLSSAGFARATVRSLQNANAQVKPNWLLFVRVKSISESVSQARQLGGSVLIAPKPELLEGKAAVIADPTGAAIGLLEWDQELMKGVR